ncbi:hypothetical protein [Bradyrhizobium centrolobii]|uniref:hypothetical protein n=1 Tax=Bradyrhizobium centrolobii TaxID=1505087 RepID=UPI000B1AD0B4|nr:hypothetical protein [Bradyrhizobium centrolobii]
MQGAADQRCKWFRQTVAHRKLATNCPWKKTSQFSSPGEMRRFLKWMGEQIAGGAAEEITAPVDQQVISGERWFRQVPSDRRWRLVPADGPLAAGFWPIENSARQDPD